MPNAIVTAGILSNVYNSRALITHNYDNAALIRGTDGVLWFTLRENYVGSPISLYRSENGFNWEKVYTGQLTSSGTRTVGIGGLNTNGPHLTLNLFEDLNRIIIWHAYYDTGGAQYDLEPFVLDITDPENITRITTDSVTAISLDADQMAIDVPYNTKTCYVSYIYFNALKVKQYRPTYQTAAEATATKTGSYFTMMGTCAHEDGWVDYLLLVNTGASTYQIAHVRYVENTGFTSEHTIETFGGMYDATDLSIAHDGYDNICAFWSRVNSTGTNIDVYYSLSSDDGVTWTTPAIIDKSAGHSYFTDSPTGQKAGRSTVIGGIKGFMLSYARNNSSGIPKTFVRTLSTTDGITYTLGDEAEIATDVAQTSEAVTGLRWFQPPAAALLDLTDPGLVRVAYQIGQGNSTIQNDTKPIRICQELLTASAYPTTDASEVYAIDTAGDTDLLVTVNILGGPSDNIDYYDQGLTGSITTRYIAAFNKIGYTARLFKYEPVSTSQMDDRSAYSSPVEYTTLITIDPASYEAPLANRGSDGFTTYIERDIRKVYLPPTFHLDRTFTINAGNFLKRTVWTVYFDGNEYELSQVIPYFINQQIAYYSANAYVIGPSNDPFSRQILPSET